MKRPLTCVNLNKAIYRLAGAGDSVRLSRALADVVVAQMLPDGVVKGGSSLLFRYGPAATRYTRDVDTARATDPDEYRTRLARALAAGWNGFAGRLVAVPRRVPKNVPAELPNSRNSCRTNSATPSNGSDFPARRRSA